MSLFQRGEFHLHSGAEAKWKIECDELTEEDWAALALMLAERLPPFGSVEGVPRGGLRLAEAMKPHATHGPLLIVDDVYTTGNSMETHRAGRPVIGAVIFARNPISRFHSWIFPLFEMGRSFSDVWRARTIRESLTDVADLYRREERKP